jgi:hypothetical protein
MTLAAIQMDQRVSAAPTVVKEDAGESGTWGQSCGFSVESTEERADV